MKLPSTGPASPQTLLAIYLNDHYAGAIGALEVARRSRGSNTTPPLSVDLDRLIAELTDDRRALEQVMSLLGVARSGFKSTAAYLAEKAGRAKLNGQLTGYSPLSRVVELEGLALAVAHKRNLWQSLAQLAQRDDRLSTIDFDELIARADRQAKVLELQRLAATETALP
jgi:predicted DNA-binding ribbon-helix-helix protein